MLDERDELGGDETLDRVVAELRKLPPVNPVATARIVAAAIEQRRQGGADVPLLTPTIAERGTKQRRWWRVRSLSLPAAGTLALAAGLAGFMVRGVVPGTPTVAAPVAVVVADSPVMVQAAERLIASDDAEVPTQFLLEAKGVSRVAIVGPFNDWNPSANQLRRSNGSDVWSITLPLAPGRHMYAFVVDDSVWTVDPRAPKATDADFGRPGSVVVVGAGPQ